MVPRLVGEGEGAEPPGCGCRVDTPRVSPCRADPHLLQKAPLSLSPAAGAPPRAGYRAAPRLFWGANVPGRAEPSRGGCQNTPAPSFLHACPPPGAGSEFRGCPEFPRCQPVGGGAGRPLHSHRDRGWVVFLRWHQLLGLERPLVRRPLSLRGDYLLAAALFSPGHGACVGCGSCAGKPQSPWSDRGMGPLALPLPAPRLTPPAPDPARQLRLCRAGEQAR